MTITEAAERAEALHTALSGRRCVVTLQWLDGMLRPSSPRVWRAAIGGDDAAFAHAFHAPTPEDALRGLVENLQKDVADRIARLSAVVAP